MDRRYQDEIGEEFTELVTRLQKELLRVANELRSGKSDDSELRELLSKVEKAAVSEEEIFATEKLRQAIESIENIENNEIISINEGDEEDNITPVGEQIRVEFDIENQAVEAIEREVEIDKIVNSVSELNDIFHDLNTLVIQQGEIVDHISNNIEITNDNNRNAARNLYSADKWDRRKQRCSLILIVIVTILILLLISLII